MQAIILAAGMGKRLGNLTQDNTKCMIKVNGITLIERMLSQLDKQNLDKIIIVIGYEGKKLESFISTLNIQTPIEFTQNPIFYITNNIYSLYLVKDKLYEDDTILLESDLIFDDIILKKIINNDYPSLALVAKFESWMDGTVVIIDEFDNIKRFITKNEFKYDEISSYHKTVNIYKFSKEFSETHYVPFLEAYCKALGKNEYYEQVLKVITLLEKPEIKALRIENENWYEIDDIQDLDIAESVFAHDKDKLEKIKIRLGGFWRYPNMLNFSNLWNSNYPNNKLKAELKANFDRLIDEHPSGLEVNILLAAKHFNIKQDYICVGNGISELINSLMSILQGKIGMCFPLLDDYSNYIHNSDILYYVPTNKNLSFNSNDLINFFEKKEINSLIIINPNNYSGNFINKIELNLLLNWSRWNEITLIVDESHLDFSDDVENCSLLNNQDLTDFPNLIVIKSISESYGVSGLRIGVIASSNKENMTFIKRNLSICNINSFAEFYLQIFGKYESEYRKSCELLIQEREIFYKNLQKVPYLRVIPSQANFFLCEVLQSIKSSVLAQELLCKKNILVKDCNNTQVNNQYNYIRIAIRNNIDNNILINSLLEIESALTC